MKTDFNSLLKTITLCAQSQLTLFSPMDCSQPGSSVHEIFQARILEWGAISFSRGFSQPRDQSRSPALVGEFFTTSATWEAQWPFTGTEVTETVELVPMRTCQMSRKRRAKLIAMAGDAECFGNNKTKWWEKQTKMVKRLRNSKVF